jgi:hypothetical protein
MQLNYEDLVKIQIDSYLRLPPPLTSPNSDRRICIYKSGITSLLRGTEQPKDKDQQIIFGSLKKKKAILNHPLVDKS